MFFAYVNIHLGFSSILAELGLATIRDSRVRALTLEKLDGTVNTNESNTIYSDPGH